MLRTKNQPAQMSRLIFSFLKYSRIFESSDYIPFSSARVLVVISQTEDGPKYWIAPGNV